MLTFGGVVSGGGLLAARKATICITQVVPPLRNALALYWPATGTTRSSAMLSPPPYSSSRLAKFAPGPVVAACTMLPATNRSIGLVVFTELVLLTELFPCQAAVTSTGLEVQIRLFSRIRTSGLLAAAWNVMVPVVAPPAMLLA